MSFRLHAGPKLLTLFHDAKSPSSQHILSLLQARVRPVTLEASGGDAADVTARTKKDAASSPATQYLKDAASPVLDIYPSSFEFEVVDRKRATADQWNTIGAYLSRNRRSQIEELKGEEGGILVNWDDGRALQTEAEVKTMLDKLARDGSQQGKGSGWRSWFSS